MRLVLLLLLAARPFVEKVLAEEKLCAPFCSTNPRSWADKCASFAKCAECDDCFPAPPAAAPAPGAYVCASHPCKISKASRLGDVGTTTVGGTDERTGTTFLAGENIYGPFEAGFGERQDSILRGLGCTDPSDGCVP